MRAVPDEPMPPRSLEGPAARVATRLSLEPHPEGGFFREVFRSARRVRPDDGRGPRAALTTIDFLLTAGGASRWHQVDSDEAWHFHEGTPLELWTLSPDLEELQRHLLGPLDDGGRRHHTVPAGWWQAARTTGAYSLVACTVGPGFDFTDFRLAAETPGLAERLERRHPAAAVFL